MNLILGTGALAGSRASRKRGHPWAFLAAAQFPIQRGRRAFWSSCIPSGHPQMLGDPRCSVGQEVATGHTRSTRALWPLTSCAQEGRRDSHPGVTSTYSLASDGTAQVTLEQREELTELSGLERQGPVSRACPVWSLALSTRGNWVTHRDKVLGPGRKPACDPGVLGAKERRWGRPQGGQEEVRAQAASQCGPSWPGQCPLCVLI